MSMHVTIKEIALRAGVSRGTVDRVIHKRGNVSPFVRQKIENVITELGYKRNIIASRLAYNQQIRIGLMIPHPSEDAYWSLPYKGIMEAAAEMSHLGLELIPLYFNLTDKTSFQSICQKIQIADYDAMILAPVFKTEATQWLHSLDNPSSPIICFNTLLEEQVEHQFYIGQNSYQAGTLGGKLLHLALQGLPINILMINIGQQTLNAFHIQQKENGLRNYFSAIQDPYKISSIDVPDYSNISYVAAEIQKGLDNAEGVNGIFISNSKAYRVIEALSVLDDLEYKIVGFDLLSENIHDLQQGNIDFLIDQHSKQQGYEAVKQIVNTLIFHQKPRKINYLPLDIIVKENLPVL